MIAYQCISILSKHGAVVVRHDFHFPDRWKYSSSAAFTANVTLPDGVVRVQEHAAWSAFNDRFSNVFSLDSKVEELGDTFRRLVKLSIIV